MTIGLGIPPPQEQSTLGKFLLCTWTLTYFDYNLTSLSMNPTAQYDQVMLICNNTNEIPFKSQIEFLANFFISCFTACALQFYIFVTPILSSNSACDCQIFQN